MNETWRKLNANMHQYVPFRANMGQHCTLSAVQRKTAFLEQSWWPEFDMFGSMPWCSLADAKELLKSTVYSLNLIDEFTSLFSPKVIVAGLPRQSLPCLCGHQCFSVVAHQDSPKASPRAIFKWKNLIEPLKLLSQWMKREKAECQHAPICAIPCQHGPTLQFVSCAEKDSLSGTVMMAWIWHVWINTMVLVPMAQAPPKAGAKELSYNSLNLIPHPWLRRRWLLQVCLGKPSHGNRKK